MTSFVYILLCKGIFCGHRITGSVIDTESVSLIERIAAELQLQGRENKQIIPSLIDFMIGRFYIVILFTKRFHGSADFPFQTRSQSVCTK